MRLLLPLFLIFALTSAHLPLPAPLSDFILPPDIAYHNSATLGACPRVVITNATDDWMAMEQDPADLYFGGSATQPSSVAKMAAVRAAAAAFIGATPNEVALVPSTTVAINAVAEGLVASGYLRPGDVVLQSDQEHMGGRSGFLHYSRLGFFSIDYFSIPMHGSTSHSLLASIAAALTPRTRVVCLSHVTTTTGIRLPIKQIAELLRSKNILLVVDGAQSAGAIAVDMRDLAADVYCISAHKWLLAPKGSGIMFVSNSTQPLLQSALFDEGYAPYTGATGTRPSHTIAGLGAALNYMAAYGMQNVEAHNMRLRDKAFLRLLPFELDATAPCRRSVRIVSPQPGDLASPLVTFGLPHNVTSPWFAAQMLQRGFVVKPSGNITGDGGPNFPPHAIRLSFHLFNDEPGVAKLIDAVADVLCAIS